MTYVQNVTDIDDRSINAAKETGEYYHDIVDRLLRRIQRVYAETRRTRIRLRAVRDKVHRTDPNDDPRVDRRRTRVRDAGWNLLSRRDIRELWSLANRNTDELEAGARIEVDEHKEDPLDFALWKFAKPGEPRWTFEPYGDGRPGWHIECSAMARALLDSDGNGFDIHGGGADLIFPHHENEIAQSEPLMARPPMANFWVHGGLLLFDNRKMAKSLGNFEPLSQLLERHDPQAIRWLFLQTGYRKVMNFTEDSIGAAALGLARIKAAYRESAPATDGEPVGAPELDARMEAALDDDMNTAAALAVLYDAVARFVA